MRSSTRPDRCLAPSGRRTAGGEPPVRPEREADSTGAADAVFAPVVTRLGAHGVDLDDTCAARSRVVPSPSAFAESHDAAHREPRVLAEEEIE